MTIFIRSLAEKDFESADEILRLAFRSPVSRLQDLRLYRQIQPDGWFAAEQEGQLVGMVGAATYGALAHVGFMAVHPNSQRKGIGLALMEFLLARLEQHQVQMVTLDASEMGRPLYERLGFIPFDDTFVFQRPAKIPLTIKPPNVQVLSAGDLDELVQWDTRVFGADRRKVFQVLLSNYPGRAFLQRDRQGQLAGCLFAQRSRIGPWVMLYSTPAEVLLQAALALSYEGMISVCVPTVNREAISFFQGHGFEHVRTNCHMGRGTGSPPGQRQKIYSQTSLAVG